MKIIRFLFVAFITLSLFFGLNYKWGQAPPIGKFLDPFNGFWQNAESSEIKYLTSIASGALSNTVIVKFDERLVPHIFAQNDYDLYFAQGFVTAQHRLWQMEVQTIFASGRLSEILGGEFIKLDREQRRQGMVFGAENALKAAMKDSIASNILKAYSDGFNQYLKTLNYKSLPIEYKILDYQPEEWSPLKTCLLLKYMAKDLGGYDKDLEMTNALKAFDRETFNLLFSDNFTSKAEPIIPAGTNWDFKPLTISPQENDTVITTTNPALTQPEPDNGSNNWAISGKKTASGNPILANDPHLGLNLPSLWYEIQLQSKGVNVYGASLPGAPGVIIGFNDSISWGVTNAERYVIDWYKVTFKDNNRTEYKYDNQWKQTQRVIEEIKIRNKTSFYDTVHYTVHGPVAYDQNFFQENKPVGYAMRWIAHDPSLEVLSFYYLNRATNYKEYVKALKYYSSPAQNFVFASASGDIAMWIAGKFPIKRKNQGRFLMDGNKPSNTWKEYIPFEHSPNVLNPTRDFVSSANQHPVDSTYPYNAFEGDFEYYRNRRINQVLSNKNNITVKDFMELQNDNYNLLAAENLPFWLSHLDSTAFTPAEQRHFNTLSNWDYYNNTASEAASIHHIWTDTLYAMVWDEMQNDTLPLPYPEMFTTLKLLKTKPNHFIFNIKETALTENATDLIRISYKESVKKVERIKKGHSLRKLEWGTLKATRVRHLLRAIEPFHSDTLLVGGNKGIVNAISPTHGPSWRMIVELGKEVKAYGVYPGGQSGNPGSPYYNSFIKTWEKGEYYKLNFLSSNNDKNSNIIHTQTFRKK